MRAGTGASSTEAPPAAPERDVYVYFDDAAEAHAPFDALRPAERLGR